MGLPPSTPGVQKREIILSLTSFNTTTGGSGRTKRHTAEQRQTWNIKRERSPKIYIF